MLNGEDLKNQGQQLVLSVEEIAWKERAFNTVVVLAIGDEPFTAEDVRRIAGDPTHPNAMGALLSYCGRKGFIHKVGRRNATRSSLHASELTVWSGR